MSWFHQLLGQDLKSVAQRETEFDRNTGDIERGVWEGVGDWIWQRDPEMIAKKRQELETAAMRGSGAYQALERESKKRFAGDIDLKDVDYSTTKEDLQDQLAESKDLRKYGELASSAGATDKEIKGLGVGALVELAQRKRKDKEYNSQGAVRARGREDRAETRLDNAEMRDVRNFEQARLDRLDSRRDALDLRMDELQLRRDQQADKMDIHRQQVANQRADKKQATMMALIQGLATLGSGFAI